jgi:putative membrane protein
MKAFTVALTIGTALLAPHAFAQTNNPATLSPDTPRVETGQPGGNPPNNADQLFVRQASLGGAAEVELGKLAEQRSKNPAVKDFARHMIADHSKANDQLGSLAKPQKISLRTDWDTDHKVMRDQLSKLNGQAFDELYIRSQIADHQKTAQLLEWHIDAAQNDALKNYSIQTLPTVLAHLEAAKQIQAQLAQSAP